MPARFAAITGQGRQAFPPGSLSYHAWQSMAICLLLAVAVGVVFGQTLHHQFVNFDDNLCVYENPAISHGLSLHGFIWAFTHGLNGNWVPLTALSHMLDCQIYHLQPGGHHLTNVLLHGATAILLFLVLQKMTRTVWRSAFVAAVFAIHPLRVESVAWVAERKDVLSGLFFVLALWAYVRYVRIPAAGFRSPFYWLTLLLYALGLMSKPMVVTLPLVLLLLDYWPLNRLSSGLPGAAPPWPRVWLRLLLEKIPFLLLGVVACEVTVLAQSDAMRFGQDIAFPARLSNALVSYAAYLWQMVYPVGLAAFYPYPAPASSFWSAGWSALVLVLICAGVMVGGRRHPYLLVGWLWYLGMLVPVIGLIQVGEQARADRYTYLPQIGLYLMVAWGAADLCGRWRWGRILLGTAAAAALAGLLVAACLQTVYWRDSVSLWTHTLACTSENDIACYNLGNALASQGNLVDATRQFERALRLNPSADDVHNNLGLALAGQGRFSEAIEHYRLALQLNPKNAQAHYNLAVVLAGQGNLPDAIAHYRQALAIETGYGVIHNDLGNALASQGKLDEAIEQYRQALQLEPNYADAHNNLGNALVSQGKLAEAIEHYEQALRLNPDYAQARNNLGIALAEQGKLAEAIEQCQQALDLATEQNQTALAATFRNQLKSYQQAMAQAPVP
jgi:tetratricopeptide (TPR) repeat protein